MFTNDLFNLIPLYSPLEQFEICSYSTNPSITTTYYLDILQHTYFSNIALYNQLTETGSIFDLLIIFLIIKLISNLYAGELKSSNIIFIFLFILASLTSIYITSFSDNVTVFHYIFNDPITNLEQTKSVFKFITTEVSMFYFFSVFFCFVFIYMIIYLMFKNTLSNNYNRLIPNIYQVLSETIYKASLDLFVSTLGKHITNQEFFIKIYTIFLFLIISNVQGMIPYMNTLTSALTNTFFMALALFISIIVTILDKKGINYFLSLFMPPGCPIALIFLLIPIELISYSFRVVSLSVRLFANMMAGHTLLKVIVGFS